MLVPLKRKHGRLLWLLLASSAVLGTMAAATAHPGRTDGFGCHMDHCHRLEDPSDTTSSTPTTDPDDEEEEKDSDSEESAQKPVLVEFTSNKFGILTLYGPQRVILSAERAKGYLVDGWNKLQVSGQGIVKQTYYLFLDSKRSFAPFFIALREKPSRAPFPVPKIKATALPHYAEAMPLHHRHSTCKKLNLSIPPTQVRRSSCAFENLKEELLHTGPFFSTQNMPSEVFLTYHEFLEEFHRFHPTRQLTVLGEKLLRTSWNGLMGFEAASYAAFQRGDCRRVHTIVTDLAQLSLQSAITSTHLALCYEHANLKNEALALLQSTLSSSPQNSPQIASLLYHLARIKGKTALQEAETLYSQCMQRFPWFQPCYERLADIAVARGQHGDQERIMGSWDSFRQSQVTKPVSDAIALYEQKRYQSALQLLASMSYHTLSFSSMWLRMVIEHELGIKKKYPHLHIAYLSRILDESTAEKVLHLVRTQNYEPSQEIALQIMARHYYHHDYFHITRLANYLFEGKRCHKLLAMRLPSSKGTLSEDYQKALDLKSKCIILSRLDRDTIKKYLVFVHKLVNGSWRSYYRLAEFYHRKNMRKTALEYYEHALKKGPPESESENMRFNIKHIDRDYRPTTTASLAH